MRSAAVPREWFKSSASGTENCVEVAVDAGVWVRDSKVPERSLLHFTRSSWSAFTGSLPPTHSTGR
ncbi:DUF397 domain-containing protein [Streptomyces sp. Tue6028]|uniref:DUF397 domain-containing protein n=1 Tax=Streptomyces sp. Tue6028 TaxID=2036037 RepID=UPI003EBB4B7F